jgi:hypothetical protein
MANDDLLREYELCLEPARVMAVFCQAVVSLFMALPAVAQSQAFATITIKPARSADLRNLLRRLEEQGLACSIKFNLPINDKYIIVYQYSFT